MRCAKCEADNREGRKFCASCGSPLALACPKCGTPNVAGEQFCGECGNVLRPSPAAQVSRQPPAAQSPDLTGERRHLTILFCDLVGSTTLTARLDPEEWRATVSQYQQAASDAISRYDGAVVRYVGDGIMAFFGYPVAHDNDAERAARAGLAILEGVAQLNQRPASIKLSIRIGIDSGPVVVGIGAGQAVDAFGDAANIAARAQAMAEPDTVLVTGGTYRLIAGLFEVEDRGAHQLKGIERPLQLYRAVRPSGVRGRFEAAAAAGSLTLFVGREDELRSLLSRWARVRDGEGQVVTISGEAGIGKSRVVRRFREEIAASPHLWLQAGAGAFFQSTPFYPVTELLRQLTNSGSAIDPTAQLDSALRAVGLNAAEAIPLLAPLLILPPSPEYPPSAMSPEQQRRRLLATLVEWLLRAARDRPLVAVIEDLHWVDPSTLELIQLLVEQGATAQLLLLYTSRPEFRPPWPPRAHHLQLTLDRLSSRDVRTIVGAVAANRALADETITTLVERTGGVPLFVEELTRAVLESGGAGPDAHEIPATLHDSLMARLDRLGNAKEVLQIGAVLGNEFSYELLRAVHPVTEQKIQEGLQSLTDAELLYVRGLPPDATYQFKHALIRDAAYEALLKSRRKELHRAVACTIGEQFPTFEEIHPEIIARHWAEAGDESKAVEFLHLAGERAGSRAAHTEAVSYFSEALARLATLPPAIDEARHCTLLLDLGREQRKVGEQLKAQEIFIRAAEIAQKSGSIEKMVQAAQELVRLTFQVGLPYDVALRLLSDALEMIPRTDSVPRAEILAGLAVLLATIGTPLRAIDYAEQAVTMSRRLQSPEALEVALHAAAFAYREPSEPKHLSLRLSSSKERIELFNRAISKQIPLYEDHFHEALSHLEEAFTEAGDIVAADTVFETWARDVEEKKVTFAESLVAARGAARALMRGEFELSEKLARAALELGQRLDGNNVAAGQFSLQMFALHRERGQLKEIEPLVRMFLKQNSMADTWRPGLAIIYSELNRTEEARIEFEQMASNDFEDVPRDALWMGSMTYLADISVFLGDKYRASILYRLLLPFDGRNAVIGYSMVCYGALSRYLGALAATLERWDDAAHHFEDALAMNGRMGAWPWLAHTQYQYATMLLSRDLSSDRDRAFALLDSALSTARRLGMRGLEERITTALNKQP
jgi:class 3 adenylate cyclase/tetratricopeptide (TPR) repeat protein